MSRYNWMTAATWAVPFVCLILAFYIGYYKLQQYNLVVEQRVGIQREVAVEDQQIKRIPAPAISHLVATQDPRESYFFLVMLQNMIGASHVTFKGWTNATAQPLTAINDRTNPNGTPVTNPTPTAVPNTGGPPTLGGTPSGFDLLHLPLGVQAITTDVTVNGTYPEIRNFLYLLRNARYEQRAININDSVLGQLDDKGRLDAKLTLTRFVEPRPLEASATQNPANPPGSPGATSSNPSGAVPAMSAGAGNGSQPNNASH
jgi:hypothetical protein